MTLVTDEIQEALNKLQVSDDLFVKLPDDESKELYFDLLKTFVIGGDRHWWWESFKHESSSIVFDDGLGFKRIPSIVPSKTEVVWFVVEETSLPYYPIYESTPEIITKVIGECYGFEYYLVPKNKEWLLCENHHNRVIGVGDKIHHSLANIVA